MTSGSVGSTTGMERTARGDGTTCDTVSHVDCRASVSAMTDSTDSVTPTSSGFASSIDEGEVAVAPAEQVEHGVDRLVGGGAAEQVGVDRAVLEQGPDDPEALTLACGVDSGRTGPRR